MRNEIEVRQVVCMDCGIRFDEAHHAVCETCHNRYGFADDLFPLDIGWCCYECLPATYADCPGADIRESVRQFIESGMRCNDCLEKKAA